MLFLQDHADAHQQAMNYLQGMSLDKYDWKELLSYMPSEYMELFETHAVRS